MFTMFKQDPDGTVTKMRAGTEDECFECFGVMMSTNRPAGEVRVNRTSEFAFEAQVGEAKFFMVKR